MAKLHYKGSSDRYILESADLKRHGIEGFSKTTFDSSNQFTADVSQDAADKLVELQPDDFEIVGSERAAESDDAKSGDGDDASSGEQDSSRKRSRSS